MRAAMYHQFGQLPAVEMLPDPAPPDGGVVVRVERTGVCRSDWHAWQGHDTDVRLPHVGGHELSGTVVAVGTGVRRLRPGQRVTVPFVSGCGRCPPCREQQPQVCDAQFQPGFTHFGSFAQYVALHYADRNCVPLPEWVGLSEAASLGCRFVTAYRGLVEQAQLSEGQWVLVMGCGGVGLSAVAIARALGARVVAVDVAEARLQRARELGAELALAAGGGAESTSEGGLRLSEAALIQAVVEHTGGGAHVSVDALGDPSTVRQCLLSLRKRGRHVQIGLLLGSADPPVPLDRVVAYELSVLGSHGIAAASYAAVFELIERSQLPLSKLVASTVGLSALPATLEAMGRHGTGPEIAPGVTLVDPWRA